MAMTFPHRVPVVAGVAVRRGDALLFVRQTYGRLKGQWLLPTGLVDPGETVDAAARREAREEAGVEAELDGLLAIHTVGGENQHLFLCFLATHVSGDPTPSGDETDRAAYLTLAEMEELDEPFEPVSEAIARRVLNGDYALLPRWDFQALIFGSPEAAFM